MVSRHNNQLMEATQTQYTLRAGVWVRRRRRKKKEKSELSSSSFGAATVVFGLTATHQSTHWGAAIQTIFLFGSALGKEEEKKKSAFFSSFFAKNGNGAPGRSRIGAAIQDVERATQQPTHGRTAMHRNNLHTWAAAAAGGYYNHCNRSRITYGRGAGRRRQGAGE